MAVHAARPVHGPGGFDERYETDLQDTDYCLRVGARGLPVTCAGDIVFTHAQSATRGVYAHPHADWSLFRSRWAPVLETCAGPAASAAP